MWAWALWLACTAAETDADPVDPGPQPRVLAEPTGDCPDLTTPGSKHFVSNGEDRDFLIYYPDDRPEGMPLVFYWHPLGGTASMMVNYLDLDEVARDNGFALIVPDSLDSNPFEWNFIGGEAEAADDLALFDDLRTCAVRQLGVDVRKVHATGMSAGGLWTTFLSIHRGDALASVLVMSGGTGNLVQYEAPAGESFPALLMWGGPNDTFSSGPLDINFQETTQTFSDSLRTDGHFVVHCEHDEGHDIPPEGLDVSVAWILPHVYGEPSPWLGRDPSEMASYCTLPE